MPTGTLEQEAARQVFERILENPENFERTKDILRRTPPNILPLVIQILKDWLSRLIASVAGTAGIAIGLLLLWYYLMFLELSAAMAVTMIAIRSTVLWVNATRVIHETLQTIKTFIENCPADPDVIRRVLECIQRAIARFWQRVNPILNEFDLLYQGREINEARQIFFREYLPQLREAWNQLQSDIEKCIEELEDCPNPFLLPNYMKKMLGKWANEEGINEGIPQEELEEILQGLPIPLGLGLYAAGGKSSEEKEKEKFNPEQELVHFTLDQLRERKAAIRVKIAELEQAKKSLDDRIGNLRVEGDPTNLQHIQQLELALRNLEIELNNLYVALQNAYLECLKRTDWNSEEAEQIFKALQGISKVGSAPVQDRNSERIVNRAEEMFNRLARYQNGNVVLGIDLAIPNPAVKFTPESLSSIRRERLSMPGETRPIEVEVSGKVWRYEPNGNQWIELR